MNEIEAENLIAQAEIRVEHMGIGGGRRQFFGTINDLRRLIELAVETERKSCAKACEDHLHEHPDREIQVGNQAIRECVASIRERSD